MNDKMTLVKEQIDQMVSLVPPGALCGFSRELFSYIIQFPNYNVNEKSWTTDGGEKTIFVKEK